jgi:tetratricopeptide (TPR) repeat protein
VASLAGFPTDHVEPLLAELTGAHLLTRQGAGRYALHDLLRVYATELAHRVDSETRRRAALHRVLDHYVHAAAAASRLLDPHDDQVATTPARPGVARVDIGSHSAALAWFTAEGPVLLAAIAAAAQAGFDEHAWQLAAATREFLARRGHWHDLVSAQSTALAAAQRSADPGAQARAHRDLARAYAFLGRCGEARIHLLRALGLFRASGDLVGQANTHLKLGGLLAQLGRHGDALRHARTALNQFEQIGHQGGYARALNNLGWYHGKLGDHRTTLVYCTRALTLHRRLGDRRGQADTWDSLGHAHHHLGDYEQAAAQYRHALTLYRDLGYRSDQAATLARLGDVRFAADDRPGAREAWQHSFDILVELRHRDAGAVRLKLQHATELS